MSVESLAIALHHSKASGTARLVLVGIANHDGDGGSWPSVGTLAHYAGIQPRGVQKCIDKLIELGEVSKQVQAGGTAAFADYERPNLYEFLLSCPDNCDRTKQHRLCRVCCDVPGRASKKYVCPSCKVKLAAAETQSMKAVDKSEDNQTDPLSPGTPKPSLNHPVNKSGLPLVSTSPGAAGICWACGQQRVTDAGKYCAHCSGNGYAQPWIDCDGGCGNVRKRNTPGQKTYTCRGCQADRRAAAAEEVTV